MRPTGIGFLREAARLVDPGNRRVETSAGTLPYDYLVVSTGPELAFDEIPGLGPGKGHTDSTFTLDQAVRRGVPAVAPLGNPRGFIPVDKRYRHTKHPDVFAVGVAMAIAPPEPTPEPVGVPKTGFMTVRMAKIAAATIAAEVAGTSPPPDEEIGVICLMDMGHTATLMKAYPVLPPRQSSSMKEAIWAKWMKHGARSPTRTGASTASSMTSTT